MKTFNKLFTIFAVIMATAMMTSCLILYDDEFDSYSSYSSYNYYGNVVFENRDSNRTAYIKEIKYCKEDSSIWYSCWTCPSDHNDSDISFRLKSGKYKFQIEVIYPKYKYNKDYYDIFYTDNSSAVTVYVGLTSTLVFDGDQIYERSTD